MQKQHTPILENGFDIYNMVQIRSSELGLKIDDFIKKYGIDKKLLTRCKKSGSLPICYIQREKIERSTNSRIALFSSKRKDARKHPHKKIMKEKLSRNINLLLEYGCSTKYICEYLGCNPANITYWKNGRCLPKKNYLQKINTLLIEYGIAPNHMEYYSKFYFGVDYVRENIPNFDKEKISNLSSKEAKKKGSLSLAKKSGLHFTTIEKIINKGNCIDESYVYLLDSLMKEKISYVERKSMD